MSYQFETTSNIVVGQGPTETPIVVGPNTGTAVPVQRAQPKYVDVVNIFNSFSLAYVNNSHKNLVPLIILGPTEPVPSGTPAGTAILRIVN